MFLVKQFAKQVAVLLIAMAPLTGCNGKPSYSYLMTHPNTLKQAVTDCQSIDDRATNDINQCQIVMNAAADLIFVINQQQDDPEEFGQTILDAEMSWVKAKEKLKLSKQSLDQLKNQKASKAQLKVAESNFNKAKIACQEQREKVNMLLGVAGMNSPAA